MQNLIIIQYNQRFIGYISSCTLIIIPNSTIFQNVLLKLNRGVVFESVPKYKFGLAIMFY